LILRGNQLVFVALLASIASPLNAQVTPAYVALGDSIEFGLGDDIAGDGFGYVGAFGAFLSTLLQQQVVVQNFGEPFAQARDVRQTQLRNALAALSGHQPVIVSWGAGGNDLGEVATGPQAAACRRSQSCLGRFNGLLNEVAQTIDRTIRDLREAVGPNGRILMRTQYNALRRSGCASPEVVALGDVTLEGAPGTVLDRGLNDRIRSVAERYDATVVDLFVPFAFGANVLVSSDCIHPSGVGYQAVTALFQVAFLAGP
jgi:lysophospholipase L1-like esterase